MNKNTYVRKVKYEVLWTTRGMQRLVPNRGMEKDFFYRKDSNREKPIIFRRCGGLRQWLKGAHSEVLATTGTRGETIIIPCTNYAAALGALGFTSSSSMPGTQQALNAIFEEGSQAQWCQGGRILQQGQPSECKILPRGKQCFNVKVQAQSHFM